MQQLGALLNVEDKIRKCKSAEEVCVLAANATRNLAGARQVFVWHWTRKNQLTLSAISSLDKVDQTSPFVQWLTRITRKFGKSVDVTQSIQFHIADYSNEADPELKTYPFPFMNWIPLIDENGKSMGGILLSKESDWGENNQARLAHLGKAYSHALTRFTKRKFRQHSVAKTKIAACIIGAFVGASMFLPVTLTTLAPVSITPQDAFVVTAPIDGVIENIVVQPNSSVKSGDLIVKLEDEKLLNEYEVAKRQLDEAQTRLKSLTKTSFADVDAKRDLRVVASQVKIKSAELDHAKMLLERSRIQASRDGVVVFADREEWIGATGANRRANHENCQS